MLATVRAFFDLIDPETGQVCTAVLYVSIQCVMVCVCGGVGGGVSWALSAGHVCGGLCGSPDVYYSSVYKGYREKDICTESSLHPPPGAAPWRANQHTSHLLRCVLTGL